MSHQLWQHRAQQLADGRAQVVFSLVMFLSCEDRVLGLIGGAAVASASRSSGEAQPYGLYGEHRSDEIGVRSRRIPA